MINNVDIALIWYGHCDKILQRYNNTSYIYIRVMYNMINMWALVAHLMLWKFPVEVLVILLLLLMAGCWLLAAGCWLTR